MEYKNKVSVVNTMIGSGKTSAAINYINSSTEDERFIVITSCLRLKDIGENAQKRTLKNYVMKTEIRRA